MLTIQSGTPDTVRDALVLRILDRLDRNIPVLFLTSGGPSAAIAVSVCREVTSRSHPRTNQLKWIFTVSLLDERFGPAGHADSNWQYLLDAGLDPRNFGTIPLLRPTATGTPEVSAVDFTMTVNRFNAFLSAASEKRQEGGLYIAGLLGIGSDGHTAGILPGSPPSLLPEEGLVFGTGYQSAIFPRITIAPAFFPCIDFAAVWASGTEKKKELIRLLDSVSYNEQPAQLLKLVQETIVYTDLSEGTSFTLSAVPTS